MDPLPPLNSPLASFQRAWEFACRRSSISGNPMLIIRTGLAEQPFRVTTDPEEDAEIAAHVLP